MIGLAKGISLGGSGWVNDPSHNYVNDYLFHSQPSDPVVYDNRSYITNSNTSWVGFWLSWWDMQGQDTAWPVPTSIPASWAQLEAANPKWAILDQQIAAANAAGRFPMIRLAQYFPKWARVSATTPPNFDARSALPTSTNASSPWAWWLIYVINRYKIGVPVNSRGPHVPGAGESDNAYFGNPLGATISGIAPINEVNQVSFGRDRVQATAEMIQTAVSAQEFWNTPYVLYVPDVADVPTDGTPDNVPANTYPYDLYTAGVLNLLPGRFTHTKGLLVWSAHNYYDIKYNSPVGGVYASTRAAHIRSLLYSKNWSALSGNTALALTEGGLNVYGGQQTTAEQRDKCRRNFQMMVAMPDVNLWTNHEMRDGGTFWTGFYDTAGYQRAWGGVWPTL